MLSRIIWHTYAGSTLFFIEELLFCAAFDSKCFLLSIFK